METKTNSQMNTTIKISTPGPSAMTIEELNDLGISNERITKLPNTDAVLVSNTSALEVAKLEINMECIIETVN